MVVVVQVVSRCSSSVVLRPTGSRHLLGSLVHDGLHPRQRPQGGVAERGLGGARAGVGVGRRRRL